MGLSDERHVDVGAINPAFYPVIEHLYLQSGLGDGAHPDAGIRRFNTALSSYIKKEPSSPFVQKVQQIFLSRPGMSSDHFTDLLARSAQFAFRREKNVDYVAFSDDQWKSELFSLNPSDGRLNEFFRQLNERNVSTHIVERYRGLFALAHLQHRPVSLIDVGCSRNYGLPACLVPSTLFSVNRPLLDNTPGQIFSLVPNEPIQANTLVGIDATTLTDGEGLEWVKACAYYEAYERSSETFDLLDSVLNGSKQRVLTMVANVAQVPRMTIDRMRDAGADGPYDIIHASMMMYQLDPYSRANVLMFAGQMVTPDGMFVELTFDDPSSWFGKSNNVITTIRFKDGDDFTPPYQWLQWDNSRCNTVQAGKDFSFVMAKLSK